MARYQHYPYTSLNVQVGINLETDASLDLLLGNRVSVGLKQLILQTTLSWGALFSRKMPQTLGQVVLPRAGKYENHSSVY